MINKLIVLNSMEGHKFEAGKPYVYSDINTTVKDIEITSIGYRVNFDDNSSMEILSNNVMLFRSGG